MNTLRRHQALQQDSREGRNLIRKKEKSTLNFILKSVNWECSRLWWGPSPPLGACPGHRGSHLGPFVKSCHSLPTQDQNKRHGQTKLFISLSVLLIQRLVFTFEPNWGGFDSFQGSPYLPSSSNHQPIRQHFPKVLLNFFKDSEGPLNLHFLFPHPIGLLPLPLFLCLSPFLVLLVK